MDFKENPWMPTDILGSWRLVGWLEVFCSSLDLSSPRHQLRPQVPPVQKLRILDPWSLAPWILESIPAAYNHRILEVPEGSAGLEV